ncbi:MAG: hypothetical protein V4459_11895 [Pseudomonadota bacterium]
MLIWLVSLQAVAQSVVVTPPDPSLARFDLATAKPADPSDRCGVDQPGGDILICGRKKALDIDTSQMGDFAEKKVRAGVNLSPTARVSVEGESRNVGGFTSKAATIKLRIGF